MEDAIQHVPEDLTQLFKFTQLLQNIHDEGNNKFILIFQEHLLSSINSLYRDNFEIFFII